MSLTDSSFFIQSDKTVKACGYNTSAQLGISDGVNKTTPTLITGLSNVKQIACGNNHSVFLLNDYSIKLCGRNDLGQLGNGTTSTNSTLFTSSTLNGIIKLFNSLFDLIIKLLIQDNGQFKSTNGTAITYASNLPYTSSDFTSYGLDDLTKINNAVISNLINDKYKMALYRIK